MLKFTWKILRAGAVFFRIGDELFILNFDVRLTAPGLRVIRFELMISTWKVEVIPLNYTRVYFLYLPLGCP